MKITFRFFCYLIGTIILSSVFGCSSPGTTLLTCPHIPESTGISYTVWQLPNQTRSQMMSYVIKTVHGKTIVIDGGTAGDTAYLREFLHQHGPHVTAWFITHHHDDHFSALAAVLRDPQEITIDTIYASMPDAAWMAHYANKDENLHYNHFMEALATSRRSLTDVSLGQVITIDEITIEVLGIKNPEIHANPINNSCMVLRFDDTHKALLFLADLGLEAGNKLLKSSYADRLPTTYVQMAHHGQRGVSEDFYCKVNPSFCLWTAPKWLWDNDSGGGKGSGNWKTLETRAWMSKLPIKKHYVMCDGLQQIE